MYVIYINDRPLTLLANSSVSTRDRAKKMAGITSHLTANYSGKPRTLLNYADMLEKGSPKVTSVDILADDLEQLWTDFQSKYKSVEAAGGLVHNPKLDCYLLIHRRGYWDLPKGKIDDGETPLEAALREVMEETGVQDLMAGELLAMTYHTYRSHKEKRVLKPTYWYAMECTQEALLPEAEEGIERAEWKAREEILSSCSPFYASLKHMLERTWLR